MSIPPTSTAAPGWWRVVRDQAGELALSSTPDVDTDSAALPADVTVWVR